MKKYTELEIVDIVIKQANKYPGWEDDLEPRFSDFIASRSSLLFENDDAVIEAFLEFDSDNL